MAQEYLQRLGRLDSCAVSDALDQLGLQGVVTGLLRQSSDKRVSGQVCTVRLAAGAPPKTEDASVRHLGATAIDAGVPGSVIVVEQRTGIDAAGWGGILSNAAATKGIAGVIVDGPVRDVDEAAGLDFPVFSRSATARTARGRIHEAETGGSVTIGDATVNAGDYVVADRSGVAFIAAHEIVRVLEKAEAIARREAVMTKAVLSGLAVSQVMNGDYEHMLERRGGDD